MAASEIGTGWAFWRIRDALANARITGQTPWQALGALGEEIGVDELHDLSAALSLVADDGAKVRESLAARAASLRRRELADLRGRGGRAVPVDAGRPDAAVRRVPDLPGVPGSAGAARELNRKQAHEHLRRCQEGTMRHTFPGYLQIDYSRPLLAMHGARLRAAHRQGDRGASAIELAIITAILVGLAVGVLLVVMQHRGHLAANRPRVTTNEDRTGDPLRRRAARAGRPRRQRGRAGHPGPGADA